MKAWAIGFFRGLKIPIHGLSDYKSEKAENEEMQVEHAETIAITGVSINFATGCCEIEQLLKYGVFRVLEH